MRFSTVPGLLLDSALRRGPAALREALDFARDAVLAERRSRSGLDTARELAAVADALVRAVASREGWPRGAVVFAVGGYGRGDLAPFSDLDLLVFALRRSAAVRDAAAALARTLWDAGLPVSLTVRTAAGALHAMERDHATASSFLDRRRVLGDGAAAARFEERVVAPFLASSAETFVARKFDEARRRRARGGGVPGGLEPDVKEAPGGLRDLHFLRWLDLAAGAPPDAGLLPGTAPARARPLEAAYDTLLRYRCELHLHAGRRQDLMDLGVQRELAPTLPLAGEDPPPDDGAALHVRAFTPWFAAARTVARACDIALGEAPRTVRRPSPAEFLALLDRRGPVAADLRRLHRADHLAALLPEWGLVTALPQPDPYHAWTVDEHTLRAVETLDRALAGEGPGGPRLRDEADRLPSLRVLRLALLLHDVGKVLGPRGHALRSAGEIADVPERLGFSAAESRAVLRLVEDHTMLGERSAVAVRGDDVPVRELAERMGDRQSLRLLLLMTAADIGGVGHGAWTGWRAAQVLDFHDRTAALLEGRPDGPADPVAALEALLPARRRGEATDLHGMAPAGYAAAVVPERARLHADLRLRHRDAGGAPVARVAPAPAGAVDLVVAAADRTHLFADLAGTVTLAGGSILGADAFTFEDGVALDTFSVEAPLRRRTAVLRALEAAAAGAPGSVADAVRRFAARVPTSPRAVPDATVRVRRDPDAAGSGVFRVECPDRPGLLHDLARALSAAGADLRRVRVATLGPRALDVFHVRHGGAAPAPGSVTDDLLDALRRAAAAPREAGGLPGMQGPAG